jgi:Na+-transporting NADH:ubiquinone oxidoreductase subunit A
MIHIQVKRGLDLPIKGEPEQRVEDAPAISQVALTGLDYVGLKPKMLVQEGDTVAQGQALFQDKRFPTVNFTAPFGGKVTHVHRGLRRLLHSVVIQRDEGIAPRTFPAHAPETLAQLHREDVIQQLTDSGLWTAFRTRPFSQVANPDPEAAPHALFINAMDTQPLAAQPKPIIEARKEDFRHGLQVVSHLLDGKIYLCQSRGAHIPGHDLPHITPAEFSGKHPAGLAGTHIHFLCPAHAERTVWTINYQDILAIGHLFTTGTLDNHRVISFAGPAVQQPRLLRVPLGSSLRELSRGALVGDTNRIISGSVLSGRTAAPGLDFLGRYHLQVSALQEGYEREFLGWLAPGLERFSIRNVFLSGLKKAPKFSFTTSTQGSPRAIVPIGMYEDVMPLDIEPTFLLKALVSGDTEEAQRLGCLELDEEDLSLCSFVCPGKADYGPALRHALNHIEKEG